MSKTGIKEKATKEKIRKEKERSKKQKNRIQGRLQAREIEENKTKGIEEKGKSKARQK